MKRVYVLLGLSGVYGVNRFWLLPGLAAAQNISGASSATAEVLYRFLSSYGADVLAGAWILCFLNLVMVWSGRKPVRRISLALLFVLGCGVFWEYVTPLYLSRAVSDPLDVAAYLAGGLIYILCERRMKTWR